MKDEPYLFLVRSLIYTRCYLWCRTDKDSSPLFPYKSVSRHVQVKDIDKIFTTMFFTPSIFFLEKLNLSDEFPLWVIWKKLTLYLTESRRL